MRNYPGDIKMKLKKLFLIFPIAIIIIMILTFGVFAQEAVSGVVSRFNSSARTNGNVIYGNGYMIRLNVSGMLEKISMDVDDHSSFKKNYSSIQNRVDYIFEDSEGESFTHDLSGRFAGLHFDKVIVTRVQDKKTLTISVYLKPGTVYSFADGDTLQLVLDYSESYKEYIAAKEYERKLEDEALKKSLQESTPQLPDEQVIPALRAEYILDEHVATIKIDGLILIDEQGRLLYEARYLGETKYLIMFDSSKGNINLEQINTNDYMVRRVSISRDDFTNRTTIVIESEGKLYFKRNEKNEQTSFEISISSRPIVEYQPDTVINDPSYGQSDGNLDFDNSNQNNNVVGTSVPDLSVVYTNKFTHDEIVIDLSAASSYKVHRMSEHERIVIDLYGVYLNTSPKTIELNSTYIEKIRYARFLNNVARVVLDLKNPAGYADSFSPQNGYSYHVSDGKLYIRVERRIFDRYYYSNMSDRIYLLMIGEYLTSSEYNLSENMLFTSSYNSITGIYTISYNSASTYNGRMLINDSYVEYIEVRTTSGRATMSIKLNDKSVVPVPITRYIRRGSNYNYWHSTITFVKPKLPGERLVIVDAGHGGTDPGAMHNGLIEKELNIDIALRLKNLFRGTNVRIHLTRGDDSYVGLGERTAVANAMNADLFLSIHNNAYLVASTGTETFYHNTNPQTKNGVSAGEFATILQKHLISDLGLMNRGVKRADFSVLRHSLMPAALVEIAFLTNTNDASKLRDPVFRQRSAAALYKAINETLSKMN